MRKRIRVVLLIAEALFIIFLDQFSKKLALQYSPQGVYRNSGLAFSIPLPRLILYALVLIVIALLFYSFRREITQQNPYVLQALALILGGAFSNLLDRFCKGHVIDFINLPLWSVFNLADLAIFSGILMLIIKEFRKK